MLFIQFVCLVTSGTQSSSHSLVRSSSAHDAWCVWLHWVDYWWKKSHLFLFKFSVTFFLINNLIVLSHTHTSGFKNTADLLFDIESISTFGFLCEALWPHITKILSFLTCSLSSFLFFFYFPQLKKMLDELSSYNCFPFSSVSCYRKKNSVPNNPEKNCDNLHFFVCLFFVVFWSVIEP